MPVTWCYDVEDGQKYCNPGFPVGCLVSADGRPKDACVINVSQKSSVFIFDFSWDFSANAQKRESTMIFKIVFQAEFNVKNTFYVFNHVDIRITYHSGQSEGWKGARLVAATLEPKRLHI